MLILFGAALSLCQKAIAMRHFHSSGWYPCAISGSAGGNDVIFRTELRMQMLWVAIKTIGFVASSEVYLKNWVMFEGVIYLRFSIIIIYLIELI